MNQKDLLYFKNRLLEEKANLEEELATLGRVNPDNPGDWEATIDDEGVDSADENSVADKIENYEEKTAILKQLETQLIDVNIALEKIENGKYGICEKTGKPIDRNRLEANPASRTSIEHDK